MARIKSKPKQTKPRTKVTKAKKKLNLVATTSTAKGKEFERCKEWIHTQTDQKYSVEIEQNDLDDETNLEEYKNEYEEQQINQKPQPQNVKFKVDLQCEWKRCSVLCETFDEFQKHVSVHIEHIEQNGAVYECHWDLCNFEANQLNDLTMHIHYHIYHTNLKCQGEAMLLKKKVPPCLLDSRRRNYVPEITASTMECKWKDCLYKFEKIYEYFSHIKEHCRFLDKCRIIKYKKNHEAMHCEWNECSKEFTKTGRFVEHARLHSKEKILSCPNCGSTFSSYMKFYDHFKRQGSGPQFQCVQCFKYFYTEELLAGHMYFHVNCYKCTMCDMTCPSPSALALHIRYKHVPDKPFKCQLCKFSAVLKNDLAKHIMTVHETHVYECEEFGCNFSTDKLVRLKQHDKNVHDMGANIYCCHYCDKQYNLGANLSQHLIKNHNCQVPSGHARFTYRQDLDGFYRLQTMRTESLEVTQQIMSPSSHTIVKSVNAKNISYTFSDVKKTDAGLSIIIKPTDLDEEQRNCGEEEDDDEEEEDKFDMPLISQQDTSMNEVDDCIPPDDVKQTSPPPKIEDESKSADNKSIQNFSVMKRYLKKEKRNNIIIEVNELDEAGNVVNTETVRANEFCFETPLTSVE